MKAMAPVFDMFNHDPLSSTVHGFQESNQVRSLNRETAAAGEPPPRVSREPASRKDLYRVLSFGQTSRPLLRPRPHLLACILTLPSTSSKSRNLTLAFCLRMYCCCSASI